MEEKGQTGDSASMCGLALGGGGDDLEEVEGHDGVFLYCVGQIVPHRRKKVLPAPGGPLRVEPELHIFRRRGDEAMRKGRGGGAGCHGLAGDGVGQGGDRPVMAIDLPG